MCENVLSPLQSDLMCKPIVKAESVVATLCARANLFKRIPRSDQLQFCTEVEGPLH